MRIDLICVGLATALALSSCASDQASITDLDTSGVQLVSVQDDASTSAEQPTTQSQNPSSLEPHSLSAGTILSPEEIDAAGGTAAFFWSEEISDEVFDRMEGRSFGADCTVPRSGLRYVRVLHVDAQGVVYVGELVVSASVADEVVDIFKQLYDARFPIKKMHLVDDYNADDFASCADGNTSAFNYRVISGTSQISNHAYGLAIDINTFENPYCVPSTGYVFPAEAARFADRSLMEPYMIHPGDVCYNLFVSHGWSWGGDWESPKDYQHFEKV